MTRHFLLSQLIEQMVKALQTFPVSTTYFSQEQTVLRNVRWAVSRESIRSTFKEPCPVSSAEVCWGGQQLEAGGPAGEAKEIYSKNSREETVGQRALRHALERGII